MDKFLKYAGYSQMDARKYGIRYLMKEACPMKKSLFALFLLLVVLVASVAPAYAIDTMYVNTSNRLPLNVREQPNSKAKKIGSLDHGAQVGVEEIKNGWASIVFGSHDDAYVMAKFLSKTKPNTKKRTVTAASDSYASFQTVSYDVVVTPTRLTGFVNLRWTPDTKGRVIAKYFNGEILHVIAESRNWLQVFDEENMVCGFMMKKFTMPVVLDEDAE